MIYILNQIFGLLLYCNLNLTDTYSINIFRGHEQTGIWVNNPSFSYLCFLLPQHSSYKQMNVLIIIITLYSHYICIKYLSRLLLKIRLHFIFLHLALWWYFFLQYIYLSNFGFKLAPFYCSSFLLSYIFFFLSKVSDKHSPRSCLE